VSKVRTDNNCLIADSSVRQYGTWNTVVHMIFPGVQCPNIQLDCVVSCVLTERDSVTVLQNVSVHINIQVF
jgi:hypothetical protein